MHSEHDDPPLTLPKWPFYLGDALLVGLAMSIAILDNWELDGVQVFACVLAVALGAGLMVLPFVVEYLMGAREEKEDMGSEVVLFKKQLKRAEADLSEQQQRLRQLEMRSGLDDQRYELLTSAIDQKTQVELPDLKSLDERIATVEASGAKQVKVSVELEKELSAFRTAMQETIDSLNAVQSRLDILETIPREPSADSEDSKPEGTNEANAARKRSKKTDSGLLQRAIQEKQDAATAVSRIIAPASQSSASHDNKTEATELKQPDAEPAASEVEAVEDDNAEPTPAVEEISSEIDLLPEDFSVSLGEDLMMDDDLFGAGETAKPKKSKPGKTKTTIVTVNKLMGIGNKPFLRGSGGGLNWEKGLEMEFQEMGKWTWTAPEGLSEDIEVQVYTNDKNADRKGKYTLRPGQPLEISPEF